MFEQSAHTPSEQGVCNPCQRVKSKRALNIVLRIILYVPMLCIHCKLKEDFIMHCSVQLGLKVDLIYSCSVV